MRTRTQCALLLAGCVAVGLVLTVADCHGG